ncbi:hypothetical protein N7E02_01010 (plasmid) [Aliirhizobium terrae]|uniref:hypothetical protein n=1 Tax=Terrirhizobium terrae TaxID=2926709 RepID=UPI00257679E1|nr:hypothetical protein [Rhizobium sp. CC-CFT758]WJH38028.1 hypothetical protein N7E02_01010 [Rhizobium sp. CC-CFT758]
MFHPIRYLRGYVYPRHEAPFSGSLHTSATDAVLGVVAVLSSVLAVAYGLTILAGL